MTSATQPTMSVSEDVKGRHWKPILEGDLRRKAMEAVWQIAESLPSILTPQDIDLEERPAMFHPSAVVCWKAETGLFYAYLAKALGHTASAKRSWDYLDEAITEASEHLNSAWMFGGFTQLGWMIANLEGIVFSPEDTESCDAVDEIINEDLNQSGWQSDYDLISGLVGYGIYALERLPQKAATEISRKVVTKLWESAVHSEQGITWHTNAALLPEWQVQLCPNGYYNLGLAHGVPGVIGLLGRNIAAGIEPERSWILLGGAVRWLLEQQLPTDWDSSFPSWAGPGIEPEISKVAWCYGDLGAATALLYAAQSVGQTEWENEAIKILRKASSRSFESAGVFDASLCHGAAGNAHIFNRIYQATGNQEFKEAAITWYERALGDWRSKDGNTGFSTAEIDEVSKEMRRIYKPGLLDGAAGIGLALLAASTNLMPEWDRAMLISLPPKAM